MLTKNIIKALLGAASTVVLLGAFAAQAQTAAPVTGEANDHTSAGAVKQPAPKAKNATGNVNPGVVPPQVGEANDQTSPNATMRPAPKAKSMRHKAKKHTKPPVTGEANDHSSSGGTTEAAAAAKAASK
ncbi:MAG: hypothetical protein QFF03_25110 [Pseudomonadota bacterium]|nr:hypothetical protein [Pseudomonadota bacterium]